MKSDASPAPSSAQLTDETRILHEETWSSPEERIRRLKELQGIGARLVGPQTIEEIDVRIREFRGDD